MKIAAILMVCFALTSMVLISGCAESEDSVGSTEEVKETLQDVSSDLEDIDSTLDDIESKIG